MRHVLAGLLVTGLAVACLRFSPTAATTDDAAGMIDAPTPDAGDCAEISATCADGSTLRSCTAIGNPAIDQTCSWGCIEAPTAHCGVLAPSGGGVKTEDLDPATLGTLGDVVLGTAVTLDSTAGTIGGVTGFTFTVRGTVGVFQFKTLRIAAPLTLVGTRAVVLVADGAIVVDSNIRVQGCNPASAPGPGGFAGAQPGTQGGGSGAGASGNGGGGGGHGAAGGNGDQPAGGTAFGDDPITVLAGGGAGGAGDVEGGGGGGALQLASNTSITIGPLGGINAGGCGGARANGGGQSAGGGGAGGTILLEAPVVAVAGSLAVNGGGGGGGGGGGASAGENGPLSRQGAIGGSAGNNGGPGGDGGDPGHLGGHTVMGASSSGGGGGAIGRIRFATRTGTADLSGVLSPAPTDTPTTATVGTARVQ